MQGLGEEAAQRPQAGERPLPGEGPLPGRRLPGHVGLRQRQRDLALAQQAQVLDAAGGQERLERQPLRPRRTQRLHEAHVLPAVRAGGDGVASVHPRQPRLDRRDRPRQLLVDDGLGGRGRAGRRGAHHVLQRRKEPLGRRGRRPRR